METSDQITKIQAKLKKLIKLQEGAIKVGNEHEATAAAAAIQRLLVQYNLSMDDIDISEKPKDSVVEDFASWYTYKFIGGDWEYRLMATICRWNFCKCFIHGDRADRKMLIVGLPQNMETAKWLHATLCQRFVELGKIKYKLYQGLIEYAYKPIGLDTYLRKYLTGCSMGLNAKFQEESDLQKKQDEVFATKVTSLVLRNDTALVEFLETKYHFTKSRKTNTKIDIVLMHGFKDGKNATFHKAVKAAADEQINKIKMLG